MPTPADQPELTAPPPPDDHDIDDRFIPVRIESLVAGMAREAQAAGVGERMLAQLADALRDVIGQESVALRRALDATYDPFNPDRDTIEDVALDHDDAGAREALRDAVDYLLDKANFFRLSDVQIEKALKEANTHGIRVRFKWDQIEELHLWVRGLAKTERKFRTIKAPIKGRLREIDVYRRLVVVAKLRDDRHVYLKLFRNIPTADLESLLPHARVSMNWMDRAKVAAGAGGTLGALGTAAAKAAAAASLFNVVYLVGVPFALLGWRSFAGYRRALSHRDRQRTQNLYYLNLASNASVIHTLITRTSAEEVKEALLLYAACATQMCGVPASVEQLDERIERFLRERFDIKVNFDAPDAFETLDRLGLWADRPNFEVLPIEQAIAKLREHYCNRATWSYHHEAVRARRAAQPATETA